VDDTKPGERRLTAPVGCGFSALPVMPVQVQLVCLECEQSMVCIAQLPPLLLSADKGPPMPDYMHQCPECGKQVRTKRPWPAIRYEPHPMFASEPALPETYSTEE
jgi:hypothetical protein